MSSDVLSSVIGAVIGFILAQFVNVAKLVWNHWWRPILKIEPVNKGFLLYCGDLEIGSGAFMGTTIYGFKIRNCGRSISVGVKAQVIEFSVKKARAVDFLTLSEGAYTLYEYTSADADLGGHEFLLVPGASVTVFLAQTDKEHEPVLYPSMPLPEHCEEICQDAIEYRFKIAVFDTDYRLAEKEICVDA